VNIFIHIQVHLAATVFGSFWCGGKADCDSDGGGGSGDGDSPLGMGRRKGLERRWKKK
jgi:hypothetical protein